MTLDSWVRLLMASNSSGETWLLHHHALDDAAAVAELREQQLAAFAQVVKPAANGDRLAFVLADVADRGDGCFGDFHFR